MYQTFPKFCNSRPYCGG